MSTCVGKNGLSLGRCAGKIAAAAAIEVGIAILWRKTDQNIEVLLTRRPAGTHLEGLWELPGGKIEPGESAVQAARREVGEELGVDAGDLEELVAVDYAYADRAVRLHACIGEVAASTRARNLQVAEHRWVTLDSLHEYEMPPANRSIIEAIHSRLGRASRDRPA